MQKNQVKTISKHALQRLPYYLNYLKKKQKEGIINISSPMIAMELDLNEVQVRKDIASVSNRDGRPKTGHNVELLIEDIENFLGYNNVDHAVLVGAGQLGSALLHYKGFENYGLEIIAAFDSNPCLFNQEINGIKVTSVDKLEDLVSRLKVHIGIITVPAQYAQDVCNKMIRGGVLAIWNFAPVHLNVPDNILVHNENMASSLAVLSRHLKEKMTTKK